MNPSQAILADIATVFKKHARQNALYAFSGTFHTTNSRRAIKGTTFDIRVDDEGNQYVTSAAQPREKTLTTTEVIDRILKTDTKLKTASKRLTHAVVSIAR